MILVNNFGVFDVPPSERDTTEFNNFSQIARTLQYNVLRYKKGVDLSPYTNNSIYYGGAVTEIDKNTNLTVFGGTLRNVYESKLILTLEATEPLVNYLDFIAETVTYSVGQVLTEVVKNNTHVRINNNNIPIYSKIRFSNSAQEYLIVGASGNSYEVMPGFLDNYSAGTNITIMQTTVDTAANSIKKLLLLAGIPTTFIGSSFDFYHQNDMASGILFRQNVSKSDNITLKNYLEKILEMSALRIFTRAGKIEINRIGDYHKISPTLFNSDALYSVRQYLTFDSLLYGYYLPYNAGGEKINYAENYLTDSEASVYDNRKIYMVGGAQDPKELRIVYNSFSAAYKIGELLLDYYKKPKRMIEANVKYIDPKTKNPVVVYVGDGVNVYFNNKLSLFQVMSLERNAKEYLIRVRLQE